LVAIFVLLVSPNLEIGKEALDSLSKRDTMCGKFVTLEIIFKVRRSKALPVNQWLFYLACAMSCNVINPVLSPIRSWILTVHLYTGRTMMTIYGVLDLADMPAELTTARAPLDRGGLNFLKLGCEELAAWDLFAVFETDHIRLSRGS